ncbi:Hypothetical predicted protein [Cloeon dipterum]|uniref:Uncharacterized protein n=2 Tax=Cloeon dipterum TaxID=197152 RepID=A0A8S1DNM2_9INSE|nr:Hypothetical predicted protein [Cloeon dipterum]
MEIINQKTGDTAFHKIVSNGLEETRNFCESSKYDQKILEVSNFAHQRPIHVSVAAKNPALVRYLLQKGAEVDSFKKGDWTSLMVASAQTGAAAAEIAEILIDAGANAELKNKDGWTAMHIACRTGHVTVVQLLARHRPTLVTTPSRNGRLPLHIAALNAHTAVVKFLIEVGGVESASKADFCGSTPVLDAAAGGSLETLAFLAGLDDLRKHKDGRGLNCLHRAAQIGNVELLRFLVEEKRFNLDEETRDGFSAVMLAAMEGNVAAVSLIFRFGAATQTSSRNGKDLSQLECCEI